MKALILIGAMLIAGCSASISSSPSPVEPVVSDGIHGHAQAETNGPLLSVGTSGEQGEIVDFKLKDGTRCVSFASFKTGAGITCDWQHEQTH
jgi:hypothetical protein